MTDLMPEATISAPFVFTLHKFTGGWDESPLDTDKGIPLPPRSARHIDMVYGSGLKDTAHSLLSRSQGMNLSMSKNVCRKLRGKQSAKIIQCIDFA